MVMSLYSHACECLGERLKHQKCILEEMKSRLTSGSACYH